MQTSKPTSGIFGAGLVVLALSAGTAFAFDPETKVNPDDEPRTILRYGYNALKSGKFDQAIGAFRLGAKKNDLASQWKLARMLQTGNGVERDDVAAYNLYAKIANRFADRAPKGHDRAYVSHAVVAIGLYSLTGIKGTNVRANPRRAEDHFYRAAALYKDPEAQYQLGALYRNGRLGVKQPRSAARWFGLAARKGHPYAQAQLGEMLFYGEGVRKSPVRGLVFMTKAAGATARQGVSKIDDMRREAFARASQAQRRAAEKIIAELQLQPNRSVRRFALEVPGVGGQALPASQTD